jgi:hypothetical protein
MKKYFTFIFVLFALLHNRVQASPNLLKTNWVQTETNPNEFAWEYVLAAHKWLLANSNELELNAVRSSEIGTHYLFIQKHQGVLVYGASFKLNISLDGKILSESDQLIPIQNLLPIEKASSGLNQKDLVFFHSNENWQVLKRLVQGNEKGEMSEYLYTLNNDLVQTKVLDLMVRKDTLVQTKVYNPDPLTTAEKAYGEGGLWKNYAGADSPELTGELKQKTIQIKFENDTFYAASPYITILDLESPVQTVFRSTQANFSFTRSQSVFREMNCLYHIQTLREYLSSIGLPLTGMQVLQVDPTAYQGQDQSRFSYSQSNPALFFGTGGVPDAEDADVIIHEYTHGINYFIAPNTTNGNERLAVEEANCDFMACQYSKAISTFKWREVFNWDGHNDYWDGRNANSANTYPKDLSSDFYVSSLIWSSMLNDLSDDLGREVITKILLNSIYSYYPNMTMQTAAKLLMQSDSILYGYEHGVIMAQRLNARGFSVVAGIEKLRAINGLNLINSQGFAEGNGNLIVNTTYSDLLTFELSNINGEVIKKSNGFEQQIELNPKDFSSGIYLLRCSDKKGNTSVIKLVRTN